MEWIAALVVGTALAAARDAPLLYFAVGALTGWLAWRVMRLEERLRRLEGERKRQATQAPATTPRPVAPPQTAVRASLQTTSPAAPEPVAQPAAAAAMRSSPAPAWNWRDNAAARWLLRGNVPVKVGVLVSFFGVAFLLKYAVEQGWMRLPVEFRLAGIAAFGAGLLALGWRLRNANRVYAVSIQGGGIGILYLTTFSALRLFEVLPAPAAFALLVLIAAGAGVLAVRQNARILAVLGALGGFLAPLLASTGSGSHVALFAYYLVLNAGIAGIAWFRHWRMLNLIGFAFTFGIGLAWGARFYQPAYFASVEPFLIAHFLLYTAIAILSATQQPYRLRGYVDSALVFGLPLVAFPLQAALLDGRSLPLAWTASVLAVFYAALATALRRLFGERLALLSQVYVALAVVFATLAVPLWLDAPWVSNTWALEAAAMIAIGLKQRRTLTHWAGVALLGMAALAYLYSLRYVETAPVLLNERFIGGFMLCAALSVCAWRYGEHREQLPKDLPLELITAAAAWSGWLLLAHGELFTHAPRALQATFSLGAITFLTVVLDAASARWLRPARVLAASILPLMFVHWLWWSVDRTHLFAAYGWLVWPAAWAVLARVVYVQRTQRAWMLPASIWLLALWLIVETNYLAGRLFEPAGGWKIAVVLLTLSAYSRLLRRPAERVFGESFNPRVSLAPLLAGLAAAVLLWNLSTPGRFAPLPFLPVLNVMFLVSFIAMAASGWQARALWPRRELWPLAAAVAALFLVTADVARAVHHLGGVHFGLHALWHSGSFQAALSIVWSLFGIMGMTIGARRVQRVIWFAGAGLMAIVVVKLFLVDLGNTGSLTRIVSFIGVGLLLLVVGYLAPAPAVTGNQGVRTE